MILTLCTQTQDKHLEILPCKHIDKQAHKDWQICNFLTGTHKIKYIHPANAKKEENHYLHKKNNDWLTRALMNKSIYIFFEFIGH